MNQSMNDRSFDLLPAAIAQRVACRRASRTVFASSIALGLIAIGTFVSSQWIDGQSMRTLEGAQSLGAPVVAIEAEIAQLHNERSAIEEQLNTQRDIGVSIPACGIVRAIQLSLPQGALLERIDLEFANIQGSNRKVRRATKETDAARALHGEIAGIATDEADVGALVDALAALAPMQRVSLESSRSREFLGRSAREFRVTFTVDLDRRWKLPVLNAVTTVSGAQP